MVLLLIGLTACGGETKYDPLNKYNDFVLTSSTCGHGRIYLNTRDHSYFESGVQMIVQITQVHPTFSDCQVDSTAILHPNGTSFTTSMYHSKSPTAGCDQAGLPKQWEDTYNYTLNKDPVNGDTLTLTSTSCTDVYRSKASY